ncbi:hypothetical protein SAMN05192529_10942 [Arachidicoccus rhizosphaerae]|uniref:Uncharacterized protein n=1 Tax=Arachidicoccus rhizosphaerae TaxID=551991 RepID=A0A1H3YUQ9_9BACT|nr:hypothetical protein SAMN05192529_10942 [Arachidicoccus rhizosphaerae]
MKEWFSITTDNFKYIDWIKGPYTSFNGPLILDGKIASVIGGFGNMIFQGKFRPLFDM